MPEEKGTADGGDQDDLCGIAPKYGASKIAARYDRKVTK
jgi:hypothetical protein